ncbi:MAG: hypothetical protein DWQ01_09855 [Planctomycetota bacterium]|nr:MAG: hypothetical protein DWQ01_09855 [Planctomycetota bacterium]
MSDTGPEQQDEPKASRLDRPRSSPRQTRHSVQTAGLPKAPGIVRVSPGALQLVAAVLGVALGLALSFTIQATSDPGSLMGRLFALSTIQGLIPAAMVVMLCWGICLCLLRFWRLVSAEGLTKSSVATRLLQDLERQSSTEVLERIEKADVRDASPLVRRVRVVLRQWVARPSLQDSLSLMQQQSIAEAEEIQHAFGVVKTFVWALPVVGLIGTVIGIALAVGDFGSLLEGDVEDVAVIKNSLVQVTGGLAFAFTTTLLGLAGALVLALPSAALQSREERLVTRNEKQVTDVFLPVLQRLYPEQVSTSSPDEVEELSQTLRQAAKNVVLAAGDAAQELMAEGKRRFEEWHQGIVKTHQEAADDVEKAVQSAAQLGAMEAQFKDTSELLLSALKQVTEASSGIAANHSSVASTISHLAQSNFAKDVVALQNTLASIGTQTTESSEALQALSKTTEQVLECQRSLQESLLKLESMQMPTALRELRKTLDHVSVVLASFQEPVVFQAVRMSAVVDANRPTERDDDNSVRDE